MRDGDESRPLTHERLDRRRGILGAEHLRPVHDDPVAARELVERLIETRVLGVGRHDLVACLPLSPPSARLTPPVVEWVSATRSGGLATASANAAPAAEAAAW